MTCEALRYCDNGHCMRIPDYTYLLSVSRENKKNPLLFLFHCDQIAWKLNSWKDLNWANIEAVTDFDPAFLPAGLCWDKKRGKEKNCCRSAEIIYFYFFHRVEICCLLEPALRHSELCYLAASSVYPTLSETLISLSTYPAIGKRQNSHKRLGAIKKSQYRNKQ